jgi:hypothetical protein
VHRRQPRPLPEEGTNNLLRVYLRYTEFSFSQNFPIPKSLFGILRSLRNFCFFGSGLRKGLRKGTPFATLLI